MGDTRGFMTDDYLQQATPLTTQALGMGGGMQTPSYNQPLTPNLQGGMMQSGMMQGGQQSPATIAPADGKAFFRQARSRLPQDSFNQFLASIKRLNNQAQSREDTLLEARQLFGPQNEDLYFQFENLLNSQGLA